MGQHLKPWKASLRPHKSRAVQTRGAEKPRRSVMAEPARRLATIVRFDRAGWIMNRGLAVNGGDFESCVVTAHLSDGRTMTDTAIVRYEKHERERIMKAIADNDVEWAPAVESRVLWRRARALEVTRANLTRAFGVTPGFAPEPQSAAA